MAELFRLLPGGKAECLLCPHFCRIAAGKKGICGVRKNDGSGIILETYGILSGYALDPVEKKPLYHFFPGKSILSAGSFGCNMRCDFCQNYDISQQFPERPHREMGPEEVVRAALSYQHNIGVAFTYNEPVIWFEYMRDTAIAAREAGLFTAMVSNGFVNPDPLEEITGFIDGFNIDLKAFNDKFYRNLTGSDIEPVKAGLKQIAGSGRHLEITTLIIPGQNDDPAEMALETEWIARELGEEVPFHLSRYFPMYKRRDPSTSRGSMEKLASIASSNLKYVYVGNMQTETGSNTSCPECGLTVTERSGYSINLVNIDDHGNCRGCGKKIYRYFNPGEQPAR